MVEQLGIKGDFLPFSGTAALSAGFKALRMTWIPFVVQTHFYCVNVLSFTKTVAKVTGLQRSPDPSPGFPPRSASHPTFVAELVMLPSTVVLSTLVAFEVPFLFPGPVWGAP